MEPGRVFAVTKLGTIDELRDRLTRSSIEEYLKNVLTVSWEPKGDVRPESYAMAHDILLHFGLSAGDNFGMSDVQKKVVNIIDSLYYDSKNYHGPIDSEGNYNSATTNKEMFDKFLEEAIYNLTELLYSVIRDALDNAEIELDRREAMRRERVVEAPVDTTKPASKTSEETTTLLSDKIERFEKIQAISTENLKLAQELAELRKKAVEIEKKIEVNEESIRKLS